MLAAPALLGAGRALAQDGVFRIGLVAPTTGPLAGFGEAQDWIIAGLKEALAGLTNNGAPVKVEIIVKDSQSNPNRAAEVAQELILNDGIHLMLTHATPDTTNPVADQCELNEVPCISTNCPWQPWFFGRGGNPEVGFNYTYHFFWGLEDIIANFTAIWDASGVAKKVGGLFPNDADGNAWGDATLGLPGPLAAAGYELVDPGRYQPMNNDFSAQIAAIKAAGVEIVTRGDDPAGFRHLLGAGRAAGLCAKGGDDWQGAPVPVLGGRFGGQGRRVDDRGVVDAGLSLCLVLDRHVSEGPWGWLCGRDRQAVDGDAGLQPCPVRGGSGCGQAGGGPDGQRQHHGSDCRDRSADHGRPD